MEKKATRVAYGEALVKLGESNDLIEQALSLITNQDK